MCHHTMRRSLLALGLIALGCADTIAPIDLVGTACVASSDCRAPMRCYQGVCVNALRCNLNGFLDPGET